jgi:hypothetical protein
MVMKEYTPGVSIMAGKVPKKRYRERFQHLFAPIISREREKVNHSGTAEKNFGA